MGWLIVSSLLRFGSEPFANWTSEVLQTSDSRAKSLGWLFRRCPVIGVRLFELNVGTGEEVDA